MKVTMDDVGRKAGVTKMTVSRALRNPQSVRRETWKKIQDAANSLNYKVQRRNAQALEIIWLMYRPEKDPNCSNELLSRQIEGVNEASLQQGCNLRMLYFDESQTMESLIWRISNPLPDGLLISSDYPDSAHIKFSFKTLIQALGELELSVVAIGSSARHIQTNRVYKNDVAGSYMAIEHLLELGHRHIAFFNRNPEQHIGYRNRYRGYKAALELAGIELNPDYYQVANGNGLILECAREVEYLMSLDKPPTAIFAVNDYLAIEIIKMLTYKGLRVPDDCSVVGYDNISESLHTNPPLTTVDTRIGLLQSNAVKLLCEIIENPLSERVFRQIEIEPLLMIRQSGAGPR